MPIAATMPNVMPTPTSGDTGRSFVKLVLHDNPENKLVHSQTHSVCSEPSPFLTTRLLEEREAPKLAPPQASSESQPEQSAGRLTLQMCSNSSQRQTCVPAIEDAAGTQLWLAPHVSSAVQPGGGCGLGGGGLGGGGGYGLGDGDLGGGGGYGFGDGGGLAQTAATFGTGSGTSTPAVLLTHWPVHGSTLVYGDAKG